MGVKEVGDEGVSDTIQVKHQNYIVAFIVLEA